MFDTPHSIRFPSTRFASVVALVAAIVLGVLVLPPVADAAPPAPEQLAVPAQASPAGATALQPLGPCRVFDSRETPNAGRINAQSWRLQLVGGRCPIPAGVRAVALNVTSVGSIAPGYATLWPTGSARPLVSTLNYETNAIVGNSAVVQVGAGGTVDLYVHTPTHVVVDVTAVFVDAPAAVSAGRYIPANPTRLLDTRTTGQRGSSQLNIPLPSGVPADATAVAVSITTVDAATPGFLTAFPRGAARPNVAVVNADVNNRTRANLAFVPVSAQGFSLYRFMTTDVVVDFLGHFTGASGPSDTAGRFVPRAPQRVWDSRVSADPVHPGGTVEKAIAPAGAGAIVANVTAVEPTAGGFVSAYAAGTARPFVSSLNYRWRHPAGSLAVTRVSTRGVGFYSLSGVHLVVDVAGHFTGSALAATSARPGNPFPPGNSPVIFISDSAFAGIRWSGSLGYLQGAAWDSRLESCRRLIGVSCRGREGYPPRTAEVELSTVQAGRYRMAVIATGYNDWSGTFPQALDRIIAQTRAKGIDRVVWVTYRERVGYVAPYGASNWAAYAFANAHLRAAVASGRYPELILADWHTFTINRPAWLTSDGVHLTGTGAREAAIYLSRKLATLERRPCPAGIGGVPAPGGWCADPDFTGPP